MPRHVESAFGEAVVSASSHCIQPLAINELPRSEVEDFWQSVDNRCQASSAGKLMFHKLAPIYIPTWIEIPVLHLANLMMTTPVLTVVVPVFNEQSCLAETFRRLDNVRSALAHMAELQFLFVDDGSGDGSLAVLDDLADRYQYVQVIALSRNFGHQTAATAGIDHASGDFVALIDADLQDPPEQLGGMLELALKGFDVVYGVRRQRRGETLFKKASAAIFYRLLNYLCDTTIPRDTGDFRIMSRRVVTMLCAMREKHRFIRGMVPWVGFRSTGFEYDRDPRFAGETKYPLKKMLQFAWNAVLSFSWKPLTIAARLGAMIVAAGLVGAGYMLYLKLFTSIPVPGVTAVLVTIVIFGGFQIVLVSLVGEYVARVFEEVKGRPLYVVAHSKNVRSNTLG